MKLCGVTSYILSVKYLIWTWLKITSLQNEALNKQTRGSKLTEEQANKIKTFSKTTFSKDKSIFKINSA